MARCSIREGWHWGQGEYSACRAVLTLRLLRLRVLERSFLCRLRVRILFDGGFGDFGGWALERPGWMVKVVRRKREDAMRATFCEC